MSMNDIPSILFITDDQHRYDYLEMTGRFPVSTPNLARLAREGVWHRHAYSVCPLCMPARCSLHNGLYAHQHGVNQNLRHWPLGLTSFPQVLQAAGYRTAAIGKLHVYEGVPERLDLSTVRKQVMSLGYDELIEVGGKSMAWYAQCDWTHDMDTKGLYQTYLADGECRQANGDRAAPFPLPTKEYHDIWIGDRCVDWLERYEGDQPFFLWAGLVSPHFPYNAPAEEVARHDPALQPPCIDNPEPGDWPLRRAHYAAMVEIVDRQVGRLLEVLERRGLLDNTLIIFTSDHGEMLGDHGLSGKCRAYDPSTRVPCLARWPGHIRPGTVSEALIELIDLPATLVAAGTGGDEITSHLDRSPGRSLLPHWIDPALPVRPFVYSEDGGHFVPAWQMVRDHHWKYVVQTREHGGSGHTGEDPARLDLSRNAGAPFEWLFDLVNDPDECRNVADDPDNVKIKEELRMSLLQHVANTPAPIRD
jgi:arylsulfatase A-like enzyme